MNVCLAWKLISEKDDSRKLADRLVQNSGDRSTKL